MNGKSLCGEQLIEVVFKNTDFFYVLDVDFLYPVVAELLSVP